jgi:hypothetical protein
LAHLAAIPEHLAAAPNHPDQTVLSTCLSCFVGHLLSIFAMMRSAKVMAFQIADSEAAERSSIPVH